MSGTEILNIIGHKRPSCKTCTIANALFGSINGIDSSLAYVA